MPVMFLAFSVAWMEWAACCRGAMLDAMGAALKSTRPAGRVVILHLDTQKFEVRDAA